jgi:hypothetical protein
MGAELGYLSGSFKGADERMGTDLGYLSGSFNGAGETMGLRETSLGLREII